MTSEDAVRLFLCGDVMTGRGIDQILPTPGDPQLHEPWVRTALEYVAMAERLSGPIPRRAGFDYVWGEAGAVWERLQPHARIVNLETSVTTSREADPDKGIHYRMHPGNVRCLTAAHIDCCVLANNHVLDWGRRGLEQTLRTLHAAGLKTAGAGGDDVQAAAPAVIAVPGGRVLVYGLAFASSGTPRAWGAGQARPGVNWFADLSAQTVEAVCRPMRRDRHPGDLIIVSLHWGGNWGFEVRGSEREFAHRLIEAGVDLVHGHSSHHPRGIEVYRGKAILYGCGDLLNDYEGIPGYESYRPELSLMYFPRLAPGSGELIALTLIAVRRRRFRLQKASAQETAWLLATMDGECRRWGVRVRQGNGNALYIDWPGRCGPRSV